MRVGDAAARHTDRVLRLDHRGMTAAARVVSTAAANDAAAAANDAAANDAAAAAAWRMAFSAERLTEAVVAVESLHVKPRGGLGRPVARASPPRPLAA